MNDFFEKDESNRFGFEKVNNRIVFKTPPILYSDGPENRGKSIEKLIKYLRILKIYENKKNDVENISQSDHSSNYNIKSIEAYIHLLDDYCKNGEYKYLQENDEFSSKRINWCKTIKNGNIILKSNKIDKDSKNGGEDFIYGSFVSKGVSTNEKDLFIQIYKKTINEVLSLFFGKKHVKLDVGVPERMYLPIIEKFMNTHYKDREINISKQLKVIYGKDSIKSNIEKKFEYKYHEKFEHIFQFMIDTVLKKYTVKEFLKMKKQGIYYNLKDEKKSSGLDLRMDHLIKIKYRYIILDSKFYNIDEEKSKLPLTNDIIKQIGYKLIIANELKVKHKDYELFDLIEMIENKFIFPTKNNTATFAYHNTEKKDENGLFHIECIKVNIFQLIDAFLNKEPYFELIRILENTKNEKK